MANADQLKKRYFPAWNAAFRANWVRMDGRIVPNPQRRDTELVAQVETVALAIARARHRGVTDGDIRHAVHLVAIGTDVSSKDLTQPQFDRVLTKLYLLINPDNLRAVMADADPTIAARRRLEWVLKNRFQPGYVSALSQSIYGTRAWETLNYEQLKNLSRLLRSRPKARKVT